MILADKIILHRKKLGLTQEALAEKLAVSRQSVSKWEGAQSIPDMSKIIMLSDLFGVSIDYLLRDDYGEPEYSMDESDVNFRKIDIGFANRYLLENKNHAKHTSLAVMMLIISPVILILLTLLKEENLITPNMEHLKQGGVIILLVIVASAVGLLIKSSGKMSAYKFLEDEVFDSEYGVEGLVNSELEKFNPIHTQNVMIGVMFIILSVTPLLATNLLTNTPLAQALGVPLLLTFISFGVGLLVKSTIEKTAYNKLLQIEDFTPKNKEQAKILGKVAGIYWLSTVAIYLALSLTSSSWDKTWIVWPIAGVLFGAISLIVSIIYDK